MPALVAALIAFLSALLISLFEFVAEFFSKRLLIIAVSVTVLVAVTVAFFAIIDTTVNAILVGVPTPVTQYIGLFLPSNFAACMSALVTAKLARWAYDWQYNILKIKMN